MKEKNTNKADRAFLDVYPEETHPQEAEPSEQVAHAETARRSISLAGTRKVCL